MTSEDSTGFVKVPIGFPSEMYEWLRATAFRRHAPMAVVVREALSEYRDRVDPQLTLPLVVTPETAKARPPR